MNNDYRKLLKLNQGIQIPSSRIISPRTIADLSRPGQEMPAMFFSAGGITVLYGMAGWAIKAYNGENEEFKQHMERFQSDFLNFLQSLGISEKEINQYRPTASPTDLLAEEEEEGESSPNGKQ